MDGIPEDVKGTARKLCDDLIQAWLLHHTREEASEIAARAILAERSRCAEIAESERDGQQMMKSQAGAQNDRKGHRDHESMAMCASFIASAIRNPTQK